MALSVLEVSQINKKSCCFKIAKSNTSFSQHKGSGFCKIVKGKQKINATQNSEFSYAKVLKKSR